MRGAEPHRRFNEAPPQADETCKPTKSARSEAQPSEAGWSGLRPDRDHKSGPARTALALLHMPVILSPAARRLLDGPNYAHLATLLPDGAPKVEPVWVAREGDFALVTADAKSRKALNMGRDARVALSITDFADPYEQLLIRGRVVEQRSDPELRFLDALSQRYTSAPFPRRNWSSRVIFVIEPFLARHARFPLVHRPAPAAADPSAPAPATGDPPCRSSSATPSCAASGK